MSYNVAVVGATGNVGRVIMDILAERNFPVKNVFAIASDKSRGKKVSFGNNVLEVNGLPNFDFSKVDISLFSPGSAVSAEFAPKAAKFSVVIDNTSYFRMDKKVPLIVPEVNIDALKGFKNKNIIANPNCVALPVTVALKPLHDVAKIKRVVITSLQSVSGAGKQSMDELFLQTKGKFTNEAILPKNFPRPIAFNLIPHIGDFLDSDYTAEEDKIRNEIQKILDPSIKVTATCVRVPVFVGHCQSVNVEFESPIDAKQASKILKRAKGVYVQDQKGSFTTPIECVGEDEVFVSRIRNDNSLKNTLNIWIVSDNLRKGAALNAVQIAEELVKKKYI